MDHRNEIKIRYSRSRVLRTDTGKTRRVGGIGRNTEVAEQANSANSSRISRHSSMPSQLRRGGKLNNSPRLHRRALPVGTTPSVSAKRPAAIFTVGRRRIARYLTEFSRFVCGTSIYLKVFNRETRNLPSAR